MPAQTQDIGRAFYGEGDTAPNLRRQLLEGDGSPMNLGVAPNVATVTISIAHQRWDFYYSPSESIVSESPCIVEDQSVEGSVGWVQWEPHGLTPPGSYLYRFRVTFPSGKERQVPVVGYETLIITPVTGG